MSDVVARRAGRIAFGAVLLAGVYVLVNFARKHEVAHAYHAWHVVAGAWLLAAAAGFLVTRLVAILPPTRDPGALRRAAFVVPSVGVALLLPITLHMPIALWSGVDTFDLWCRMAVFATGLTHVVFALLVAVRAAQLARGTTNISIGMIYWVTCVIAAIPFVIPAGFVALTGIPIVPLLRRMERIAEADRAASIELPFAVARTA